jgi:2-C-methyl-D-erythritol 4-phosphate cytidylyltransferase
MSVKALKDAVKKAAKDKFETTDVAYASEWTEVD